MASDSDDAQKIRQAELRAVRKRKVKTPASFTQSSSSTISKAPSFQFRNANFQNGYSPPVPTKTTFRYNSNNPFNNPFRFARMPKVQTPSWAAESKATGEKTVWKFSSTTKQTELKGKVSYNPFDSNIELIDDFRNLRHREYEFTNQENYIPVSTKLKQNRSFWTNTIKANDTVLNIIQERYRLPFLETPDTPRLSNKVCNI